MNFLEKIIYSCIVFIGTYAIISVGLRVSNITSIYTSHMIGGVVSTILGMGTLLYLLIKKSERDS